MIKIVALVDIMQFYGITELVRLVFKGSRHSIYNTIIHYVYTVVLRYWIKNLLSAIGGLSRYV